MTSYRGEGKRRLLDNVALLGGGLSARDENSGTAVLETDANGG